MTTDELIQKLQGVLDGPDVRAVLDAVAHRRRLDLTVTLYVDRGIIPKPPRIDLTVT